MNKDIERLNKVFENWNEDRDSYPGSVYSIIYPMSIPQTYSMRFTDNKKLIYDNYEFKPDFHRTHATVDFDLSKTLDNFKKLNTVYCYPISMYEYYVVGNSEYCKFLLSLCVDGKHSHEALLDVITEDMDSFIKLYSNCFVQKAKEDHAAEFGIATVSDGVLYTSWYNLAKSFHCDIKRNYPNDLPYDKICSIIENESKADLLLFYGEPGTGKSSLIKHLINIYHDKQFIFLDAAILQGVQPATFITYLTENENSVLILEDCEKILESREMSGGGVMSTLLNVTDGVISDILGIKLICTFNTSLQKIDKALLRKGRLSLKYEFKKLPLEKCKQINPNADKDMVLADLYNDEENDYSKNAARKIGFK